MSLQQQQKHVQPAQLQQQQQPEGRPDKKPLYHYGPNQPDKPTWAREVTPPCMCTVCHTRWQTHTHACTHTHTLACMITQRACAYKYEPAEAPVLSILSTEGFKNRKSILAEYFIKFCPAGMSLYLCLFMSTFHSKQ